MTESLAEISLQALLNFWIQRILQTMRLSSTQYKEIQNITMISKRGFDNFGEQAKYKQAFQDGTDSDAQMFLTCLVPLQLICSDAKKIIWENPRPNSTRFCRPIQFRFIKETSEIIMKEKNMLTIKLLI